MITRSDQREDPENQIEQERNIYVIISSHNYANFVNHFFSTKRKGGVMPGSNPARVLIYKLFYSRRLYNQLLDRKYIHSAQSRAARNR